MRVRKLFPGPQAAVRRERQGKVRKDKSNTHAVNYTRPQNSIKEKTSGSSEADSGKERCERRKAPCRGLVQCTPPRRRLSASWC